MKNYFIEKQNNNSYLIFSTSYINPLEELDQIEEELNYIRYKGKVIFDLLLCNGISDNRFVELYYDGEFFDIDNISILEEVDPNIRIQSRKFYNKNDYMLENSVLPNSHQHLIRNNLIF